MNFVATLGGTVCYIRRLAMQKILTDSQLGANIRRVRESKIMSQADVVREQELKGSFNVGVSLWIYRTVS